MIFTRGLAISYTHGQPLFGVPDPVSYLAYGLPAKIPMPTIIWLGSSLLCLLFLRYTRFGRGIYAVGGGEEAARLSGIQPAWYRIFPYVASGFFAALVGIMMSGRMGCGDPKIGQGWELDAIAAVVIGGTSLSGGKGSIGGTVVGVLIMGLIINIMNLLEIEAYPQQMAKGIIIVAALALHSAALPKEERMNEAGAALLEARGITKIYPGVVALDKRRLPGESGGGALPGGGERGRQVDADRDPRRFLPQGRRDDPPRGAGGGVLQPPARPGNGHRRPAPGASHPAPPERGGEHLPQPPAAAAGRGSSATPR